MLHLVLQSALAQTAPPIVDGSETEEFPAVAVLVAIDSEGYGGPYCSGTLIQDRWVLTAAHCIEYGSAYASHGFDTWAIFGNDIWRSSGIDASVAAEGLYAHPGYVPSTLDWDVGLVQLLGTPSGIEPVALNDEAPGTTWTELTFDVVGWGITGDDADDGGTKRHAEMDYAEADSQFLYAYEQGGSNVCSGDSGGPFLEQQVDGTYLLMAVISFAFEVDTPGSYCNGGGAGALRVDAALDWIESTIEEEGDPDEGSDNGGSGDGSGNLPDSTGSGTSSLADAKTGSCTTAPGGAGWLLALLLIRRRR